MKSFDFDSVQFKKWHPIFNLIKIGSTVLNLVSGLIKIPIFYLAVTEVIKLKFRESESSTLQSNTLFNHNYI